MPKMMKKAQQMRTMLPIGLRDVMRVSTTSFSPGALLITLKGRQTVTERDSKEGKERLVGGNFIDRKFKMRPKMKTLRPTFTVHSTRNVSSILKRATVQFNSIQ